MIRQGDSVDVEAELAFEESRHDADANQLVDLQRDVARSDASDAADELMGGKDPVAEVLDEYGAQARRQSRSARKAAREAAREAASDEDKHAVMDEINSFASWARAPPHPHPPPNPTAISSRLCLESPFEDHRRERRM